ncbi:hypothetical protein J7M00_06720 [bacterium]|nr:hypothetical protein [bacterium]
MNILVSFLPWIIFWVLSGKGQLKIAAATSIVAVVILAIKDFKKHSVKILAPTLTVSFKFRHFILSEPA